MPAATEIMEDEDSYEEKTLKMIVDIGNIKITKLIDDSLLIILIYKCR